MRAICCLCQPDIICIVETWLDQNIADCEIAIPNYVVTRLDRERHGGGIAIFVANYLSFSVVASGPHNLEYLDLSVIQPYGKFGISLLYRPPSAPVSFFDTLSSVLETLDIPKFSNFLFFADINIDVSTPSPLRNIFCNIMNLYNLTLSNTGHTRTTDTTATTIDVMLSSTPTLTTSCEVVPPLGSSDHNGILANIKARTAQRPPQQPRQIWRYQHGNFELANELLSQVNTSDIFSENDINITLRNFQTHFMELMERCIPRCALPRRKNLPWLTKQIIQLMHKRNALLKKSRKSPSLKSKYKQYRNKVSALIRSAKRKYFRQLKPSNKHFWKLMNSLNQKDSSIPTLNNHGSEVTSPTDKATLLGDVFSKNFNTAHPPLSDDDRFVVHPEDCPTNLLCTEDDVLNIILSLDSNKASGLDGISVKMLKETALTVSPILTAIFNHSISTGTVPDCWKTSLITPIPKQGDPSDPHNYRPISLLPVVSKVLERVIFDKLCDQLSISDRQWGFLPGRSTTGAILLATQEWHSHLEKGSEIQAVFFDLQKAFDSVPHKLLIEKLTQIGVHKHTVAWVCSYLHNRYQIVGVEGAKSQAYNVISGVPQGSVLGPLLFIVYIDGLDSVHLSGGSLSMFADDLLLYKPIHSVQDYSNLQVDVNSLANWLADHKLTLNTKKCKTLLISRKRKSLVSSLPPISIHNRALDKVQSYRYLGVLITSDLSWSDHISSICAKARKNLGLIYRKFYQDATPSTLKVLYIAFVRTQLEYAVPVWDPHLKKDISALESVQRFASRMCLKTWQDLSYEDRLRHLCLTSLENRRKFLNLCYLFKIKNDLTHFPNSPLHSVTTHHATRSHSSTLYVPIAKTNSFQGSFFCRSLQEWNQLPQAVASAESLNQFKSRLRENLS